jgi:HemY protein
MLGSIIRSLVFVGVVGAAIWGVSYLLETPGGIAITFAGRELYLTPIAAVVGLLALFAGLWLGLKVLGLLLAVLRFLTGDETALSRYFERSRMRRGLEALSRGMSAVAAGDARMAVAKARKAERLLQRPELTRLLNAQAASLAGDQRRARIYYKALASEPETAFVGVKGLLEQALDAGETDKALKLAEYGFALKPKDPKLLETLYGLQSEAFDWEGARKTLSAQRKVGMIEKREASRREATLALAQAEEAAIADRGDEAKSRAVEAAKLDPTNVDAVCAAARRLVAEGSKRAASRQIVEAWRLNPDARLAAAFAEIEPEETPSRRRKRFQRLVEANPSHPETMFLRAELALFAEDWAGARKALEELEEEEPSARSLAIMAAIARGEGEPDHVVRGWLAKALGAPRGSASEGELSQAAMLPLLVGDREDAAGGAPPAPSETGSGRAEGAGPRGAVRSAAVEDAEEASAGPGADAAPGADRRAAEGGNGGENAGAARPGDAEPEAGAAAETPEAGDGASGAEKDEKGGSRMSA